MVDFFLVGNQIGLCATYVTFMSTSLKRMLEPGVIKEPVDVRLYTLAILIPVLLMNFIRNLKRLAPVSLIGNVLILSALGCCFYYIFGVGPFKTDETRMVAPISSWPLFFGTIMFALEAVGVMIALEHNMQKPQHFLGKTGIFPWAMSLIMFIYMAVGLLSYIKYGDSTGDTVVSSLPQGEMLANAAQGFIAFAIFFSYPLQCFVGLEIIWGNCIMPNIENHDRECIYEYLMRILIVLLTFVIAIVIPHVDLVISLVGAFCLSSLGLVFPFLLELLTLWPDRLGCCCYVVFKDIIFIMIGLCILVTGTYCSLYSIIAED